MDISDIAYMANGQYGIEYDGIHWIKFDTEEEIFARLIEDFELDDIENQKQQLEEKGGYAGMVFVKCTHEYEDLPEDLWTTVIMEQVVVDDNFTTDEVLKQLDHWEETEVIKTLAWKDSKVVTV